jgi:integrase/recombinase XerD
MSSSSTSTEVIVLDPLQGLADIGAKARALFLKEARAAERFFDFFTANIQNKHTRRAYFNAACWFSEFCAKRGVHDLARMKPVHVAGYVESLRKGFANPTIKQHLAAIRMLFDWLVVGQIIEVNPAHAVRGPKHVVTKGRTPVLNREEARPALLHRHKHADGPARPGAHRRDDLHLRPRGGPCCRKVGDYFSQGRRGRVRLHEKGGKEHEAPCVPKLEAYLDAYIAAAGVGNDQDGPLFRNTGRFTGRAHRVTQQDGYLMIQRRARQAGIKTRIGNHSMCATGITEYLKSDGTLAGARANYGCPLLPAHHEALRPAQR